MDHEKPEPKPQGLHSYEDYQDEWHPYEIAGGSIIPQPIYDPYIRSESIRFIHNGHFGIRVDRARHETLTDLEDVSPLPLAIRQKTRTNFRIQWYGYREHQFFSIPLRREEDEDGKMPCVADIAKAAALAVELSLKKVQGQLLIPIPMETPGPEPHRILGGTEFLLSSLYLLELRRVSRDMWQPVLYHVPPIENWTTEAIEDVIMS